MAPHRFAAACLLVLTSLAGARALAAPPLVYGGRLTEAGGKPVAGPVDLDVAFHRDATADMPAGVGPLHFAGTPLSDGVFSLAINLSGADSLALFPDASAAVWVEVTDATHGRKYPRQRLTVVPYALRIPVDGTTLTWNASGELVSNGAGVGTVVAGSGLSGGGSGASVTLSLDYAAIPGLDNSGNAVVTSMDASALTTGVLNEARLPSASASTNGKLTSTDWTTFNNKEPAIAASTSAKYWRGDKSWQDLTTTAVSEGTNQYFTASRAKSAAVANAITGGVTDVAPSQDAVATALAAKQATSGRGAANGYADLDSSGKVPLARMPFAGLTYQGTWNANTNAPALASPSACGTQGYYYIVSTGGATSLDGIASWSLGDWVICGGTGTWQRVGNSTGGVTTVNSKTGATITLNTDDVGEGATNQYFTAGRAQTAAVADALNDGTTTVAPSQNAVFDALAGLTSTDIPEGSRLYYTEARVSANTDVAANTAARHAAVTLGTANGLSLSGQQLSLGLASGAAAGALSAADWTTFNGKQSAITTGTTSQYLRGDLSLSNFNTDVASAPSVVSANAKVSSQWTTSGADVGFTGGKVGVGTTSPGQTLTVEGSLGVLEGGASPQYHTILQGGDQSGDLTYTLPATGPSVNGQVLSATTAGVLSWVSAPTAGSTVVATAGTAAAPSFTFTGDTDNGLFLPAANVVGLATAGSERLRVDASGNVGIGRTTVAATLDVNGFMRLAKNTAPPAVCTSTNAGAVALTNTFTMCACNGTAWVETRDGESACFWNHGVQMFVYTGATESFVVPAGVTTLTVKVWAGGGGGGGGHYSTAGAAGGGGGYAESVITTTPGETLTITVGGGGGGGGGGVVASRAGGGGGGGGRSSVDRAGTWLLVAGGGGGGGGGNNSTALAGGAGGGANGTSGTGNGYASGGGGASQGSAGTAGNTGGTAGSGMLGGAGGAPGGATAGGAGAWPNGGNGGSASTGYSAGAGGGGNGYKGGGGGGYGGGGNPGGSGGGGGSGYVTGTSTSLLAGAGVVPGNDADTIRPAGVGTGGAAGAAQTNGTAGGDGYVFLKW